MVIQCENCRTVFNLDESLIKAGGSKVRCSRCRHLFMAYPPLRVSGDMEADKSIDLVGVDEKKADEDELISIFGGEEAPAARTKDEGFEADLDSVYKEAFPETAGALEEKKEAPSEAFEDLMEEEMMEKEAPPIDRPEVDLPSPIDTGDEGVGEQEFERDTEPVREGYSKKKSSKGGFFIALVVILLALLGAAAAVTYWKPELIPPSLSFLKAPEKKEPADAGVRLLQFDSVAGSFVDSEKSGRFFVIRGMVSSKYPKPRSYILIKGTILDNKGKAVENRLSYAGNTFTEEEIRTLPLEDIKKAMQNRDGMARQNFNLSPGATIPFMIVFDNLPDNLSEFAVEAVSSSPGA